MKLTKEDIKNYATDDEKEILKESKGTDLLHFKRATSQIIGLLYQINQEDVYEYGLDRILGKEKFEKFTNHIMQATAAIRKARNILEK